MENVLEQKNQRKLEDTLKQILRTPTADYMEETSNFLNKHFYANDDVKNIKNYCNNKIIEIGNRFKKSGVPMFDKSASEDEMVESKVGMAVVHTINNYLGQGMKLLEENERLQNPGNQMIKYNESSSAFGKIKGILNKIKNFITRKKEPNPLGDIAVKIKENSQKYDEICNEICEYNLEENLADSINTYLNNMYGEEYNKTQILENEIIPDFKKLGLSSRVSELKEKVVGKRNNLDQYKVDYVFEVRPKKEYNNIDIDVNNENQMEVGE
ncbi:MAG: hypothetical protein IKN65_03635 [Clostridia bacterium]|nr:hypothetical protein [Clostridia bacterium]